MKKVKLLKYISVFLLFGLSSVTLTVASQAASPIKIESGLLEGQLENDIMVYRGVPFAAPPVDELRWQPPKPAASWDGVLAAKEFGPSCMQDSAPMPMIGLPALTVSEDCLTLNIWAPDNNDDKPLPVMVWIYGGGFTGGTTVVPSYSGEELAKKGVILVSIQYRLGSFGFMAHPELTAESENKSSGNYGLLDQIAALKWVQNNISAFDGDPQRVTIFGESAGGISVSMLAASPLAKGLFSGAISQSGGSFGATHTPPAFGENVQLLPNAEQRGMALAQKLGVKTLADLRAIPAEELHVKAARGLGESWPVMDGWVLSDHPYKLYKNGNFNDVPVLIGTNADEGALFVPNITPEQHAASVKARYGDFTDTVLQAYPAEPSLVLQSARNLFRDITFAWHTWVWAELHSSGAKSSVYSYYYNHPHPAVEGMPFFSKGGSHGDEIAFVFGQLSKQPIPWNEANLAMSETLMTYWTNFAKTGNPNRPNGEGMPEWLAYTPEKPAVMHFNETSSMGSVPNVDQINAINDYMLDRLKTEGAIK